MTISASETEHNGEGKQKTHILSKPGFYGLEQKGKIHLYGGIRNESELVHSCDAYGQICRSGDLQRKFIKVLLLSSNLHDASELVEKA